jgi:hypothetical protein
MQHTRQSLKKTSDGRLQIRAPRSPQRRNQRESTFFEAMAIVAAILLLLAAAAPAARAAPWPAAGEFEFRGARRGGRQPLPRANPIALDHAAPRHAAPPPLTPRAPPPPPPPPGGPAFAEGFFVNQDGDVILARVVRNS